jgi:acetylornithine deacetylase/succinyl-diaminopimelate desuccinylase-like protein
VSTPIDRLLDLAVRIQQVPAPTFEEEERAMLVRDLFTAESLQDVSMDANHNVYGRLPGRTNINPLVVTAHLDTVFSARTPGLERTGDRIAGPGIGDNSLGVAALMGLVWMLRDGGAILDSDLWLVANACEEGLGDLKGMKAVVDRFGGEVRAYLVLEGTALGQIFHRAVGVRRYRVTVTTSGGHSWSDYGHPSAVHEVAAIITRLTSLRLPVSPRTTINVGTIAGGTGVNVLAPDARFELDVRSESAKVLSTLVAKVEHRIMGALRDGVDVGTQVIGERPAGEIPPDHALVKLARDCLEAEGITPSLTSASTDANIPLSRGIPAIVLGVTTGSGAHTPHEYIDTAPVGKGMRQIASFVMRLLKT